MNFDGFWLNGEKRYQIIPVSPQPIGTRLAPVFSDEEIFLMMDRRALNRFCWPLEGEATFHRPGQELKVEVEVRDVNAAGSYLMARTCPEVGGHVTLVLRSPSQGIRPAVEITRAAVVLRVDELAEATHGFAVEFQPLS